MAAHITSPKLAVVKSAVPVRKCNAIWRTMEFNSASPDFLFVASRPEFLKEGTAVSDVLNPERIVLGVDDTFSEQLLKEIYAP
jgi:UDPglucose 6-dehydrogenase